MLQIDKTKGPIEPAALAPDMASAEELYAAFIALVRRQFPTIVFVILLMLGLATVYIFTTPPLYTGEAVLIIDTHQSHLFQQQNTLSVDMPVDTAMVDSQVEILKSENIALSVIKDLHLTEDPEFVNPGGGLIGAVFSLVSSVANIFSSDEPKSEFALTRQALELFEKRLTIKRVMLTYVINIDYESLSPGRAAQIANAVADAYVVDSLEAKYQSTKRAAIWLQDRLKELRAQATAADRAEVDFKQKNNIIDTGGRLLNEQQLAELNSALVLAQAQTAEAKARTDRVQQILEKENQNSKFEDTATVTDSLHDDVITRLRQQYLDISAREADWSTRYGRDHLAAVNLRNQMAEIRKSIDDELRRIAETYKSDYEIAKSREDAVQKGLNNIISQSNDTNQAQITLRELDSTAQSYRAMADNFLQQYMMSVQQQSFPITESRLITEATPPLNKSHPKTLLVLAVAMAGGMILAFGIGMLRDFSDRVFRTSRQVEDDLQADCIAILPMVKEASNRDTPVAGEEDVPIFNGPRTIVRAERQLRHLIGSLFSRLTKSSRVTNVTRDSLGVSKPGKAPSSRVSGAGMNNVSSGPKMIVRDKSLLWCVIDSPFSRFSESIRAIKIAADLFGVSKSNKVIAITSSLPNEGKSTVSTALAQLTAHAGSRTILLDCDLRNPSLTRKLAPNAGVGFLEVVSGKASLEEAIWTDPDTKLAFLPCVVESRVAHSSEILGSAATKKLFDKLREMYDYVVVDLSPLAPVVDVRTTTNLVDSYVFVIEWGRTKIDVVEHAFNTTRGVYDNLLGVVLNKADINVLSRYESYRGKYYYNQYYSRYGYTD
jgi:succinoglycan biosynthesis transport protein ExoP